MSVPYVSFSEFFSSISEAIDLVNNYSRSHYYEPLECEGTVTWHTSMQILLGPAILHIIVLSFTVRRKNKYLDKLDGRPALVYPMNMLTRSQRLSYMACFGVISILIFKIVFESKQAIHYDGPIIYKALVTIVSMLIYSINCFPIFASITLKNSISYGLGSLYIWAFTIINVYTNFNCPDMNDTTKGVYQLESLPQTMSLIYLCIRVPYGFVVEVMRWYNTGEFVVKPKPLTLTDIRQTYQGVRVNGLLVGVGEKIEHEESCFVKLYRKWVYDWQDQFKFSGRIITSMWVGFVLLYYITFKSMWNTTSYSLYTLDVAIYTLDNIGWNDQAGESNIKKFARVIIKVYYYGIKVLWILIIFCFALAFVVGTFSIVYALTAYRENLSAIYRGDSTIIRPRTCKTNTGLLTSSMKYAGYQVGYIAWAFFIQTAFFIVTITVVVLVIVIMYLGFNSWSLSMLEYFGFWIVAFAIFIIGQYLLARFVFLQNSKKSPAIDNRRALFLATYILFFYNVFVGLGSCLLRLFLTMVMGVINISRLDTSLMPRRYELRDGGYDRYVGFLHIEAYHTHHVMLTFIEILKLEHRETKAIMVGVDSTQTGERRREEKKMKPGTRFQEAVVGIIFPKRLGVAHKNQVGVLPKGSTPIHYESSPAVIDTLNFERSASQVDEKKSELSTLKNSKSIPGLTKPGKPVHETRVNVINDGPEVAWEEIRESPQMKRQRRKQAARFNWALAYTLMSNPQLKMLRKGMLQQRKKNAEMGIRGKLVA